MTPIPTDATRVDPVYGWAAVAHWENGRVYMDPHSIKPRAKQVRELVGSYFPGGWAGARKRGWRVIRVQIIPAGEREEQS